jgi:hypothetical protein
MRSSLKTRFIGYIGIHRTALAHRSDVCHGCNRCPQLQAPLPTSPHSDFSSHSKSLEAVVTSQKQKQKALKKVTVCRIAAWGMTWGNSLSNAARAVAANRKPATLASASAAPPARVSFNNFRRA